MICIPIKEKSGKKALANFLKAQKKADVVEVWFDQIATENELFEKFFKLKTKPILFKYQGNKSVMDAILAFKPEYIDLDISSSSKLISKVKKLSPKTALILSSHDFDKTASNKALLALSKKMRRKGADIIKIATYAQSISDSLRMLAFLEQMKQQKHTAICICMGRHGQITRLAGHLFGNYLMYAPLSDKDATAPGQVTYAKLKKIRDLTTK